MPEVRELLSLTRRVVLNKDVIRPGVLLTEMKYLVPPEAPIRTAFSVAANLKNMHGDKTQIARVLENMILNAVQAMPRGGRLELTAVNALLGPHSVAGLLRGDYVKISIGDSGPGIKKTDRTRLFDPSYSTRGKGHGLGLATAYRIVTLHGGAITVDSRPGGGTTFTVYLPATDDPILEKTPKEPAGYALSGRVLYLEDETVVAAVGRKMLSSLGFSADTCGTGEEAVAAFRKAREEHNPYAFVLLDILIARGMGGIDTLKELRRIDPHVKTAATSGYTGDDLPANFHKYGFNAFLPKPFQIKDLRQLAEKILHGK